MKKTLSTVIVAALALPAFSQQWLGWGKNDVGQAVSPLTGSPTQVSLGPTGTNNQNYALRPDGTIYAWGPKAGVYALAPSGTFKQVEAGDGFGVGLRTDGTLVCWGSLSAPPSGSFTKFAIGPEGAIAIRTDGTLASWGGPASLMGANLPAGTFSDVAICQTVAVAIRSNGTMVKWGSNAWVPPGTYLDVEAASNDRAYALSTGGDFVMFSDSSYTSIPGPFSMISAHTTGGTWAALKLDGSTQDFGGINPPGPFNLIEAGGMFAIGRRLDGGYDTWLLTGVPVAFGMPFGMVADIASANQYSIQLRSDGAAAIQGSLNFSSIEPPRAPMSSIAVGTAHGVGIGPDATLLMFGTLFSGSGLLPTPTGSFRQVAANAGYCIGLRADGTLAGWGTGNDGITNPPGGTFTQVAAGYNFSCAIRTDGTLTAWGSNNVGQLAVPSGTFRSVSAGYNFGIGIRTDGTLAGWGLNNNGQRTVPSGQFADVAAGYSHAAGIRADGSLAAWGNNTYGQCDVPAGIFAEVVAGPYHTFARKPGVPMVFEDFYSVIPNTIREVPAPGVRWNDREVETLEVVNTPQHGTVTLHNDGSFEYEPDANYIGLDQFTYRGANSYGDGPSTVVKLKVDGPRFTKFEIAPTVVWIPQNSAPGDTSWGTLTISGLVEANTSATVAPSSSAALSWPTTVPITAGDGTRTFTFPITTQGPWFTDNSPHAVRVTFAGTTRVGVVTRRVLPRMISAVVGPSTIFETHSFNVTINIDRPAPFSSAYGAGIPVRVYSLGGTSLFKYPDAPEADTAVPPQFDVNTTDTNTKGLFVTVPPGGTSAVATVYARHVGATTATRNIQANFRTDSRIMAVQVKPLVLASHSVSPTSVDTPATAIGTVTLDNAVGNAKYGLNYLFTPVLLSSNSGSATVPVSVRVNPGAISADYIVTCTQVGANTNVTITATRNGVSKTANLTLTP